MSRNCVCVYSPVLKLTVISSLFLLGSVFLTGSDRIPIHGMSSLRIIIQSTSADEHFLPVAHTCYNLLDLPCYRSRETLRLRLTCAIEQYEGFSLVWELGCSFTHTRTFTEDGTTSDPPRRAALTVWVGTYTDPELWTPLNSEWKKSFIQFYFWGVSARIPVVHVVIRSAFFCFPAPFRVLGSASRSCTFRRALYAETGNIFARWFGVTFGRLGFFFFCFCAWWEWKNLG